MAFLTSFFRSILPGRASLGLEITDSCIKLAELHFASGKPLLVKYAMERLPPDTVVDGQIKNPLTLHRLLEQTVKLNDFGTKHVHLVIPSSFIMVRYLKFPNLPDKQLRKIIEFELQHSIHLPFDRPYFDFINMSAGEKIAANKTIEQSSASGVPPEADQAWNEMAAAEDASHTYSASSFMPEATGEEQQEEPQADVILIAAPGDIVDDLTTLVRQCGLKPISAEIKALSFLRLIEASEPQLTERTILTVDLNEAAADISIFHEGQLKITRGVPVNFSPSSDSPEQQDALQYAPLLESDAGFQNACTDLAHELERLMNFYRYTLNNRTHEFHHTVLTGDVERIEEVADYLADRLAHTVMRPRLDWLDSPLPDKTRLFSQLAIPIGLGLRGNKA